MSEVLANSQCKICGLWFDDSALDAHLNQHMDESEQPITEQTGMKCPTCNVDMEAYYGVPFRVGGTGPAMRFLIGAWAELGEEPIPIDIFVCAQCGRIQPFATLKSRERLARAAKHNP